MLITVLVMAVAVSFEPFRIGMTVLLLNRPRPLLQLTAFLCGGFAMGMSVGLVVLFVLRRALTGSGYFTLPRMQILIGVMALVAAAGVAVLPSARRQAGQERLSTWTRRLLTGRSLWVAGVAGLGIALPSMDYLAALALILSSGKGAATQVGVLLTFNVVAFSLVEVPLLAFALAPDTTRSAMTRLYEWIRARRRLEVAALLVLVGAALLTAGLAGR